ncbi:MAG: T9SS type A sorting domain-containing protein, partial [Saprospiraceae bacterium]|nr:T9SS type A sorting domain-containing protein [Saprospiraceae bacterium]
WEAGSNSTIDASATGIIRVTSGQATQDDPSGATIATNLTTNNNLFSNPGIQSISRIQDNNLDPRPSGSGAAVNTALATYPAGNAFFTPVAYKGAFSPFASDLWIKGWTALEQNQHLKDLTQGGQIEFVTDVDVQPCDNVVWTNDKTYIVDGVLFVEDCATLTIEAGTVVKFTSRADVGNPSALVVARGGKIFAEGTVDQPIIFTAEADDVADPFDLGPTDNSLWGGLAVLGKGITQKNGNSTANLEGIPTTEPRGNYGGTDNTDNSGVLKYVTIRHGGRQIVSGNELNGLSLAAVGSGTTLEYIEVYANSDDGIEFFGGAPRLKYAVVAFAEDDSYDWDEVYTGKGQFWFSIQRQDIADLGGELDGSTPDDLSPSSNPTVYNWTHIGSGPGATAANPLGWLFRAGTAGTVANCIVASQKNKALEVQDKNTGTNDAHQKLVSGDLKILNNLFWECGSNTNIDITGSGIIRVTSGQPTQDDPNALVLINHLNTNSNAIADPQIVRISRDQDNLLDPRVLTTGAAYNTTLAAYPAGDPFFTPVNYKGAFSESDVNFWLRGWTTLWTNQHIGLVNSTEQVDQALNEVFNIFPNPASGMFSVVSKFNEPVNIEIFDLSGQRLRILNSVADELTRIEIAALPAGMYLIKFTTAGGKFATKKLIVE